MLGLKPQGGSQHALWGANMTDWVAQSQIGFQDPKVDCKVTNWKSQSQNLVKNTLRNYILNIKIKHGAL